MPEEPEDSATEELLEGHEIQGNIIAGFNKDHQVFIFLRIERDGGGLAGKAVVSAVKAWLRSLAPQISSLNEVHRFNELFRALRARLGRDPQGLCATWMNIAFSSAALEILTSAEEVTEFTDSFFQAGLAESSSDLGDPTDEAAEGHPNQWVVGGPRSSADILVLVASDSPAALAERVAQLKASLTQAVDPATGAPISAALRVVWEEGGNTLPAPLTGHEHFGFKDGISQPGIRGLLRRSPMKYATPRLIDPVASPQPDPTKPELARPGQPLVWPGQFVFGYRPQSRNDARKPLNDVMMSCPAWARNGSYLVLRRLRQDVKAFQDFVAAEAPRLAAMPGFEGMTPKKLASKMVGRWPGGAPLPRSAEAENDELGRDGFANNYFQFAESSPPPLSLKPEAGYSGDTFTLSKRDQSGATCPLSAHVRKVNPRDTITEQGNSQDVLTRLILRRGIPFGPPYAGQAGAAPGAATAAAGEISPQRGLIFVSYQTSIENQFAFLQKNWANDSRNPNAGGGADPIIGQGSEEQQRHRFFDVPPAGK
ncbi:MAG TPA: Dyp-type peroxidase, partial [Bryobacteraceae bacterium]|nr:Dyp-type peroxidase [Bryobacteraceae bacterium]